MSQHTERIIIGAAIGLLGAMAVGIKLVEGVAAALRSIHEEPPTSRNVVSGPNAATNATHYEVSR